MAPYRALSAGVCVPETVDANGADEGAEEAHRLRHHEVHPLPAGACPREIDVAAPERFSVTGMTNTCNRIQFRSDFRSLVRDYARTSLPCHRVRLFDSNLSELIVLHLAVRCSVECM